MHSLWLPFYYLSSILYTPSYPANPTFCWVHNFSFCLLPTEFHQGHLCNQWFRSAPWRLVCHWRAHNWRQWFLCILNISVGSGPAVRSRFPCAPPSTPNCWWVHPFSDPVQASADAVSSLCNICVSPRRWHILSLSFGSYNLPISSL